MCLADLILCIILPSTVLRVRICFLFTQPVCGKIKTLPYCRKLSQASSLNCISLIAINGLSQKHFYLPFHATIRPGNMLSVSLKNVLHCRDLISHDANYFLWLCKTGNFAQRCNDRSLLRSLFVDASRCLNYGDIYFFYLFPRITRCFGYT